MATCTQHRVTFTSHQLWCNLTRRKSASERGKASLSMSHVWRIEGNSRSSSLCGFRTNKSHTGLSQETPPPRQQHLDLSQQSEGQDEQLDQLLHNTHPARYDQPPTINNSYPFHLFLPNFVATGTSPPAARPSSPSSGGFGGGSSGRHRFSPLRPNHDRGPPS